MKIDLHDIETVAVHPPSHFPQSPHSGAGEFWTITLEMRVQGAAGPLQIVLYSDRPDTFARLATLAAPQNGVHHKKEC